MRRDFGAKHSRPCKFTSLSRISGRRAARVAISVKRTESAPFVSLPPRTNPRQLTAMAGHNYASLTPQESDAIREMASLGNRAIADALCLNKRRVAHVAKQARGGAGVFKVDGRGRRGLLSERYIRGLSRLVQATSTASLATITELVNASRDSADSERTVRRAMEELGLTSRTPTAKPWVSDVNKVKQVAWVRLHEYWKQNDLPRFSRTSHLSRCAAPLQVVPGRARASAYYPPAWTIISERAPVDYGLGWLFCAWPHPTAACCRDSELRQVRGGVGKAHLSPPGCRLWGP